MRDCNVSLQNLTIDGGWNKGEKFPITRSSAFINVLGLDAKLEVGANVTIQNCKNQGQFDQDASGGAIYAIGVGTINFNGNITSCSAIGGAGRGEAEKKGGDGCKDAAGTPGGTGGTGGNGCGGAIYLNDAGTINFNGTIQNCSANEGAGGKGKDAYNLRINGYDGGNRENRYEDDNVEGDNEKNGAADYF